MTNVLNDITLSLTSPFIPTRKFVLEILAGYVRLEGQDSERAIQLVIQALTNLSTTNLNGETDSPYVVWFRSMEASLTGRGKMGSLVGASDEVRKNAGVESSLNDYAV
jgi:cytokinesis protein